MDRVPAISRDRRALLVGYYGTRNVGDDLMLEALLPWLERQRFIVAVVGENEEAAQGKLGGRRFIANVPLLGEWGWPHALLSGEWARLIRAIRDSDDIVIGGGDLVRDDRGWRIFAYTMEKIAAAMVFRKRVHLVNTGIGRPRHWWARLALRRALRQCRTIIVRDQRSVDVCADLAPHSRPRLLPDIVLGMDVCDDCPRPVPSAPYALVSLRATYPARTLGGTGDERAVNLASALDALVECEDLEIRFVPFQSTDSHRDEVLHESVRARMTHSSRTVELPWSSDAGRLVSLMKSAAFVLAMPLHAAVLALRAEARLVFLPYDVKCWELASCMSGGLVLDPSVLDVPLQLRQSLIDAPRTPCARLATGATEMWRDARLS